MDPELSTRIAILEQKIDAMTRIVDKLRKYFLWTGIVTIALFVLPLIGLVFAIPSFLSSYGSLDSMDSLQSAPQINDLLQ